jgi:NADP-dependent 3-hydroxy acid dehydrogenase YdfG
MFLKPSSHKYKRKSGHIIIGSTAAKEVYPNGNVCQIGMRMDFKPVRIRVGAIHPEWCRLNLEVRFKGDIEPKKYIKGSCSINQKISPTSFCIETVSSTLPIEYCTGFFYDYKKELEYLYCYY